jgi:hypothetical protein
MWTERGADNSAVLVAPNVKVKMEAQHSFPPLNLHDLLRESFTFTFYCVYTLCKHSITPPPRHRPLSLHDMLRESFAFNLVEVNTHNYCPSVADLSVIASVQH